MSNKIFVPLIIIGILLGVALVAFAWAITAQNKAINLEEGINESQSSINIQEKRRVDLLVNLVDTIQEYDEHEKETLVQLTEARTSATSGDIQEAKLSIDAVVEAYPELKSIENYKVFMNELSTTENLIAEHRNNYNIKVRAYKKHIRVFPNKFFLNLAGYEAIDTDYLEYEVSPDAPTNLFDKGD